MFRKDLDSQSKEQRFLPDGKGGQIEVSEEVYHAYWDPVRAEEKRKQREWRCRDGKGVRCKKNCMECEYYRLKGDPTGSPLSSDQLYEETEYEIAGTLPGTDPVQAFFMSEFKRELDEFLNTLNDFDRRVADGILEEQPDKVVMEDLHITKQTTYSYHKQKMRKTMQDKFRIYYEK